jgi:hypothetical protein
MFGGTHGLANAMRKAEWVMGAQQALALSVMLAAGIAACSKAGDESSSAAGSNGAPASGGDTASVAGAPPAGGGAAGTGGGGTCEHDGSVPNATVSTTAELNDAIANAAGGAVIWLNPGTYTCLELNNLSFTREAPLIIRANPNQTGAVTFLPNGCYYTARIVSSSYVVFDGFTIDGGGVGVWVEASDHVMLQNLTISNPGQEGIRLRLNSIHIDILNNLISNTGQTNPQYGECIYVGTGGDEDFPDQTEYVWIENNEVHHCGAAEGINIKPEAFHITVRGNSVHDIAPGTPDQYNQSALTVEGAGRAENHRPSDPRDVWVESNTVSNITFGEWANGIMVGGTGVYVLGNTVSNYEEQGIYVNSFGDLGLPVYVYDNQVDTRGQVDYFWGDGVDIRQSDPGANPNQPQDWYCR